RRELTPNRGKRLEENAMALLWLQATDDDEYGVVIPEAEALAQTRGLLVVGCEAPDVAAVVDHDNFLRRQALLLDEVAAVGLRDLGRADQVGPEARPVEPAEQREHVLFRAPAHQRIREVEDGNHWRSASTSARTIIRTSSGKSTSGFHASSRSASVASARRSRISLLLSKRGSISTHSSIVEKMKRPAFSARSSMST